MWTCTWYQHFWHRAWLHQEMARRSDFKRQMRKAAKEERNLAKKLQRLMQAGESGTKSKLSLSVANDCGRPPRICGLVTCSSCCCVSTSKILMVDLCSDVARIMDFVKKSGCAWVCSRLETFQALNDTGRFLTRNFAGLGQRAGANAGKSGFLVPVSLMLQRVNQTLKRLLEMLHRCFRNHVGAWSESQSLQGAMMLVQVVGKVAKVRACKASC